MKTNLRSEIQQEETKKTEMIYPTPLSVASVSSCLILLLFAVTATAQTFTTIKSFGILTNVSGFAPYSQLVKAPDGTIYGTTSFGESRGSLAIDKGGAVFKMQSDGSGFALVKYFSNIDEGADLRAGVTLSGSVLYGTTYAGGDSSYHGVVYKVNTDGTGYTVLKNFMYASDGANPSAVLTLSGDVLYGTARNGGNGPSPGYGTVFKLNTDGTGFTVLKYFTSADGANPRAGLKLFGNELYGTTYSGGSSSLGTVFKINTDGTGHTLLKHCTSSDGANPSGGLVLSDGVLYGTTRNGGSLGLGTVFRVNTNGTGYTVLQHCSASDGAHPYAGPILSGGVLYGTTLSGGSSDYGTVFKLNPDGTDYTVLKHFISSDGSDPYAGLMLSEGVLYGTTYRGGSNNLGTVYKVNTDGSAGSMLKSFTASDGANAGARLTPSGNVLYGATIRGGSDNVGAVFKVNTDGTSYTLLRSFAANEGMNPSAGLTLSGGTLYGTTVSGGSNNLGTIYRINTDGSGYTVLKHCTSSDGSYPQADMPHSGGTLYGTAGSGGISGRGTVFKVNMDGSDYAVIKHFGGVDGSSPQGLTLSGSTLYGTTWSGGSDDSGTVFKMNTDGTGFTLLKHFTNYTAGDGAHPNGNLVLSGGVLYGTTYFGGGSQGSGTVFKINTDGTAFTSLNTFTNGNDGAFPGAGLTLVGNVLHGTTREGGAYGLGTLFKIKTDGTGYTVLRHLASGDGAYPEAALSLSGSTLYGTTYEGGNLNAGAIFALDLAIPLTIAPLGDAVVLSWADPAFALQAAPTVSGGYTNVPGATSPYTNAISGDQMFFRLIGN